MAFIAAEYEVLCRHLAQAQRRCSAALEQQHRQFIAVQAELLRTRVQLLLRTTEVAWLRADLQALQTATPGGARRRSMGRQIERLTEQVAQLSRSLRLTQALAAATKPCPEGAAAACMTEGDAAQRSVAAAATQAAICQVGCVGQGMALRGENGRCERTGETCVVWDEPQ
ncbi:MAG: hypothetical protein ACK40S_08380 [Burkholderiaceae bacterium]